MLFFILINILIIHNITKYLDLEIVKHPQTILAYEMNGKKLEGGHGAPLRLRV
jgi:DMSO/TMAO reductase YedYZ molybdopterin-dependent catalytic subunit